MAKKQLKIAFLSFYSGDVNRGVESFVEELASRLSKEHQVVVFQQGAPKKEVNYDIEQVALKMNWTKKDMTGTLARRFFVDYWSRQLGKFSFKVFGRVIKERYDVVVPLNGGYQPILMRIATLLYGGKMVGVGQSGMGWDERINLLSFPDAFVPLTSKAEKWARKFNSLVKLRLIPNGVDLKKFKLDGDKFLTNLRGPVVVVVGALVPGKRIDLVIKAVSRLKSVSLLIVGDGDWKGELEKQGNKLLPGRFEIHKANFSEMPSVYRAGDVFTLVPVGAEAFGIVYIEAMATNLSVVAIDDEQRREIVGEAGMFVDPTDTEAYANALEKALKTNWGDKPRKRAEKFDWDKIAKKYEKLFLELVEQ